MSDFVAFVELGFRHITDPRGLDHVLFVLALAAIYRFRDWRGLLAVITAFTLGHSVTLALAVTGLLALPGGIIEFLIPVTILATGVENLAGDGARAAWRRRWRPLLAALFGLIHGAGFANYLRSLFMEDLAVPLLGFNLGLEVGQVAVLLLAGLGFAVLDRAIDGALRLWARAPRWSPLRIRAVAVSSAVSVVAAVWAAERLPW